MANSGTEIKLTGVIAVSMRDYFAAAAIPAAMQFQLLASASDRDSEDKDAKFKDELVKNCYDIADAMLAEREKK